MTREEADFEESQSGSVAFVYPADSDEPEDLQSSATQVDLHKIQLRAFEGAVQLLLSARTERVQHMRASVALAILKGNLNLGEIASHYRVTGERVRQIVKEVEAFETLPRP